MSVSLNTVYILYSSDNKDYALKLIEGTGYSQSFSLSACREVAVCYLVMQQCYHITTRVVVERIASSQCDPSTSCLLVPHRS